MDEIVGDEWKRLYCLQLWWPHRLPSW